MKVSRIPLSLAGVAVLATAPAAAAHVTANPGEGPAGGFAMIAFRVPHGCGDSPTTSLAIQIPPGVVNVAPQAVPGWVVETVEGPLAEPVESHGETISEGVTEVTWTGGPLDPHQFTDFGLSMRLPDTPGETVYFPAVQRCETGETRWIQIPVEGQPEPDEPAPAVLIAAASGGHGDSTGTAETSDGEQLAADGTAAPAEASDSGGSDTLAIVLGAAGLAAGLLALGVVLAQRRKSA